MKVRLCFAWYDLYVGLYYDRRNRTMYIFPIPTMGLSIEFKESSMESVSQCLNRKELEFATLTRENAELRGLLRKHQYQWQGEGLYATDVCIGCKRPKCRCAPNNCRIAAILKPGEKGGVT